MTEPLLEVRDLSVSFSTEGGLLRAVEGVSLSVGRGETVALVGESGCGKSTLARAVMGLVAPSAGDVRFAGEELRPLGHPARKPFLRRLQMVFQDPDASLNPRLTIGVSIGEPLSIAENLRGPERAARVAALMEEVGLDRTLAGRYPHELSGGQKQRACIARALAVRPELLVCDEAVSALDVSIQAQILNLLADLRDKHRLSYLFITHDLRVVRHLSTRVAVMYLGQLVESGPTDAVFDTPEHPYTRALLASVPTLPRGTRGSAVRARGDVPSPLRPPAGCRFHTRCPSVMERCKVPARPPSLVQLRTHPEHRSRCLLSDGPE